MSAIRPLPACSPSLGMTSVPHYRLEEADFAPGSKALGLRPKQVTLIHPGLHYWSMDKNVDQ